MWRRKTVVPWLIGLLALVGGTAVAVEEPPKPGDMAPGALYLPSSPSIYNVWAPPGTVYSAGLHGEADFLRAVGSLFVDSQRGRYIGAQAYQIELDNSKLAVKTYFERRLLNIEYRRMLKAAYAGNASQTKSPGEELYDKIRKGDLAKEMNWLLLAVFEQRVANNAAFMDAVDGAPADMDTETLKHLWLTDKPPDKGVIVNAGEPVPLNEEWPHLLRSPVFADARKTFEKARDEALEQIKNEGKKDYFSNEKVYQAWENLAQTFEKECNAKLHTPEEPKPQEYAEARGFLVSLQYQLYRFAKTNVKHSTYKFEGKSLAELIDHLGARGLYFAKPKAGDEGTYQFVFIKLHDMYMKGLYRNRVAEDK